MKQVIQTAPPALLAQTYLLYSAHQGSMISMMMMIITKKKQVIVLVPSVAQIEPIENRD